MKIETKCVQAGYTPGNGEPREVPIYQSTTFKYSTSEEMGKLFDLEANGYFYTRLQNPTNDTVAAKICEMEGGVAAMLTSSGARHLRSISIALYGAIMGFLGFTVFSLSGFFYKYLNSAAWLDGQTRDAVIRVADYSYETAYGMAFDGRLTLDGKPYQVRVYLDRNDYNNYKNSYVDIDEILPNVVEH